MFARRIHLRQAAVAVTTPPTASDVLAPVQQDAPRVAMAGPPGRPADALQRVLARAVVRRGAGDLAGRTVLQRELTVFIGDEACTDKSLVKRIAARLPSSPLLAGGVWFNTEQEAQAFANGTAEGMGVWNGRWVNLAGRGTIVFGEEHNEIRELFARALNIRRRLVEGAWERSLHGVPDVNIAQHAADPRSHRTYSGGGVALENYWLRAGQYMARFASPTIEALRVFADEVWTARRRNEKPTAWIPPLERPDELIELVQTLQRTTVPPPAAADRLQREIVLALDTARYYAIRCEDFGLLDLARLDAATDRGARYRRIKWIENLAQQDPARSRWLHTCYAQLASAVQRLGHLQFLASAGEEEIAQDRLRIARAAGARAQDPEASPFYLWAPRREIAMLANLRAAMLEPRPPLLVTMGADHARNRRRELEELLSGRGCLIIGDITQLAALGHERQGSSLVLTASPKSESAYI
ncbi:MAG TPA: hypothetical protein VNT54_09465 [Solirubrobacteraceae bacterium]|nr:hypothetical protein [Solirubrobacteraceae bacterium]